MRPTSRLSVLLLPVAAAAACGDNLPPLFQQEVFEASFEFQSQCEAPRDGVNPFTGAAFPDQEGSEALEKLWLRSWTHELYLWYREVPDPNPAAYPTPLDYFDVLRTPELSPTGNPKDRFHFTYPTAEWQALSLTGTSAGYGATFALLAASPPRRILVAYNEPGSPADQALLDRGDEIVSIDGVDVVDGSDVDTLNAGLFPSDPGETHTFVIDDRGTGGLRTIELTSAAIESAPVQNVSVLETADGPVGYFQFNDHIATAEPALREAVTQLAEAEVTDLVVDLRYNGGGYLVVASELAYQIAGPGPTSGQPFESLEFNDQYPGIDPFSGDPIEPMAFVDATVGLSGPADLPLDNLGLERVFVLTGPGTCSASESLMNGLRGVGIWHLLMDVGRFELWNELERNFKQLPFSDIEDAALWQHIVWLAEQGIATGCGDGRFCPYADVRRDEMAAFLARGFDLPGTATDYFTDDETSTHETAINRVRAAGIASGCTTTTFCPNTPVTRGQMAAFLHRAFD